MSFCEAVLFDMGGTLLQTRGVAAAYRCILEQHHCHVTEVQVRSWLGTARTSIASPRESADVGFMVNAEAERARRESALDHFLDLVGVRAERLSCRAAMIDSWISSEVFGLFPEVMPVLKELKGAGLVFGAVSNWEPRLPQLCANLGIAGFFDFILSSESEGFSKPSPKIFEAALSRAGVTAERTVHVGDQLVEDVQAVESLGIRAVLIHRNGTRPAPHSPSVETLSDLIPLIRAEGWIRGQVVAGRGEAAAFTCLDWVREQVQAHLGFDPYPGTLNLRPAGKVDQMYWERICSGAGVTIEPRPGYCAARCFPISVEGRSRGAIVAPLVAGYPEDLVEVMAPVGLRRLLGVAEGATVTLAIESA